MKTLSKTPYEIRLELLQLSFEILSSKCQADAGKCSSKDGNIIITTSPSTEDVIAEAEKMNAFISKAA